MCLASTVTTVPAHSFAVIAADLEMIQRLSAIPLSGASNVQSCAGCDPAALKMLIPCCYHLACRLPGVLVVDSAYQISRDFSVCSTVSIVLLESASALHDPVGHSRNLKKLLQPQICPILCHACPRRFPDQRPLCVKQSL